jgi:hypothetical protein
VSHANPGAEAPRKVSPAEIEVIDSTGQAVSGPSAKARGADSTISFGGMRVIRGGPALLLLLPLLLPLVLLAFLALAVPALLFGRSVFRVFRWRGGLR